MKDFTRQARVVEFQIDDDTFRGKPHLPSQTMIDFTLKVEGMEVENPTPQQGIDTMMECLQMVLMPESYKLFRSRMLDPSGRPRETASEALLRVKAQLQEAEFTALTGAEVLAMFDTVPELSDDASSEPDFVPIELDQVTEVLDWVMGEYGLRPTKPSADSSTGQPDPASGTPSTESTSDVESTSVTSPSTDSSTSSTSS